jgi:hypothetical protein
VASTGNGADRFGIDPAKQPSRLQRHGPISLVAADIHRGNGPAGICDGWRETSYSKRVPVRHDLNINVKSIA